MPLVQRAEAPCNDSGPITDPAPLSSSFQILPPLFSNTNKQNKGCQSSGSIWTVLSGTGWNCLGVCAGPGVELGDLYESLPAQDILKFQAGFFFAALPNAGPG